MPAQGNLQLDPFTTPATSNMTLDKQGYEMSTVTLGGEKFDADTLSSNLDISERRHASQAGSSQDGVPKDHAVEVMKETQEEMLEGEEDDTVYPSKMKLLIIVLSLCLSILCMALDNSECNMSRTWCERFASC